MEHRQHESIKLRGYIKNRKLVAQFIKYDTKILANNFNQQN